MRVPARIYATEALLKDFDATVFDQISNVASLPGVVDHVCCMPDGHSGYGFPIGGVAAFDARSGIISPGGIGFDINCGMRLITTHLDREEVQPLLERLLEKLSQRIPAGVGGQGPLRLSPSEFREALEQGARWCLKRAMAWAEDLELTEDQGCVSGADSTLVSEHAIERGLQQIGTLGSGNHYLEIQVVEEKHVADWTLARAAGITRPGQVVIMFHSGSRGFGHQVASDYLKSFLAVMEKKYGLSVPDRELACTPFQSPEGQAYFKAMKCAINMAFLNRQLILHRIREVFSEVFGKDPKELGLNMVYDISHNTAKLETHLLNGQKRELLVHRKGATRALGPKMEGLPGRYQSTGQPVIIGGSMESGSYLLFGAASGADAFYSTAHGSGRTMSRTKAKQLYDGRQLANDMKRRGILVKTASWSGLAEEAGAAYKNIDAVVEAAAKAGLSRPAVRFIPIGNVKG